MVGSWAKIAEWRSQGQPQQVFNQTVLRMGDMMFCLRAVLSENRTRPFDHGWHGFHGYGKSKSLDHGRDKADRDGTRVIRATAVKKIHVLSGGAALGSLRAL